MTTALDAEGVNTFSASGKPAGQEIYHFHMHVIPLGKGEPARFAEHWATKTSRAERSEPDRFERKLRLGLSGWEINPRCG